MRGEFSDQVEWLCWRPVLRGARLRLLCLPHAGGSPHAFRGWLDFLPEGVELHALVLPGRASLLHADPPDSVAQLISALFLVTRELTDRPYVVFGHSFGALVGFELLHALEGDSRTAAHFFASACVPPHLPRRKLAEGRTDGELAAALAELSGVLRIPGGGQSSSSLALVRADLRLYDGYEYRPRPRLACPLTAFGGRSDPIATEAELSRWRDLTRASSLTRMLPGDHFFAEARNPWFTGALRRELDVVARRVDGTRSILAEATP